MAPLRHLLAPSTDGAHAIRAMLAAALLTLAFHAAAAASWNVRVRQIDDGLPDNQVTGVVQTPDGYIWVATRSGLVRFNGTKFEPFNLLAQPGVSGIAVREMFADAQGNLWLGTNRGTLLRAGRDATLLFPGEENRPAGEFAGVAEDAQGRVWLAFGPHICALDGDRLVEVDPPGAAAASNASLARDSGGRVWGARGGKVGLLRDGQFEVRHEFDNRAGLLTPARTGGLWLLLGPQLMRLQEDKEPTVRFTLPPKVDPVCLLEDSTGAVWIGTLAHGLFRFEGKDAEAIRTPHQHVSCLTEDREGNIWAGTFGGGLNLIRRRAFELKGSQSGQPFESLTSVCEDATGSAWVSTTNGRVFRENGSDWTELPPGDGWPGNDATCVAADTQGMLYAGTQNRGLYAHDLRTGRGRIWSREDGLPGNAIRAVLAAADGTVWFAAGLPGQLCRLAGGRVQVLRQPPGLRVIRAIAQDARGDIWVGTSSGQVLKVRGDELVAAPALAAQDRISIRSLHATPDGTLWIGYASSRGIGALKDGRYTLLGAAQGLDDAPYSQMVADRLGSLWLAGKSDLSRFTLEEAAAVIDGRRPKLQVTRYGRADGLGNLQAAFENSPAAWLGRNGRILIATGTGLLELAPGQLHDNPVIPPVTIERVTMDDRIVARYASRFPLNLNPDPDQIELATAGATLRLPPEHRRLEIDFAALSYAAPENVHLRYRLDGFDRDWTETSQDRTAIYPRLPAGDYIFRVIAHNDSGVWNATGAVLPITVKPFLTQTTWFRLVLLGLFTALVAAVVRFISHRKLRRKVRLLEAQAELDQERARISRDLHDDLGGSVTHIKLLSEIALQEQGLPGPVGEHLQLITKTTGRMLNSLDEIVWAVNPLNDTLPNLISYLGQSCIALMRAAGIRPEVELPDNPPELTVTSEMRHQVLLATKEALTNVVRHAKASTVRLRISVTGSLLEIEIEDDGQGFDPALNDTFANGLRNMRQRMESVRGSLEMESRPEQGTRVRIRLPLRTAG